MVRILQVTLDRRYEPLRGGGGVARYIHGLSTELTHLGAKVCVAAYETDDEGLDYATVAAAGLALWPHIGAADVLHVHGGRRIDILLAAFLAWIRRRPFIYTPHAYYGPVRPPSGLPLILWRCREALKAVYNQTAERFLLTCGYRTILLNEHWVDEVRHRMRLPVRKVAVLPNCTRLADIAPKTRVISGRAALEILSVGRLDEVKCLDDVIRALAAPALKTGLFHVVGKGPDRDRLQDLAQALGVADRVRFHGVLSDDAVADLASRADVFVLPARQEGMPSVIIEMLLRRLPVVSSDIPGSRAIMDLAGAHWMYPLGDVEALADQIVKAAGAAVTDEMFERIVAALTWERRAPDFLNLYVAAAGAQS